MVAKLANMLKFLMIARTPGGLIVAASFKASARPTFYYTDLSLLRVPTKVTRAGVDPIHGAKCYASVLSGSVSPVICSDDAAIFNAGSAGQAPNPGGWWMAGPQAQPPFLDWTTLCHDWADMPVAACAAYGSASLFGEGGDGSWHNETPTGTSTGPQITTGIALWSFGPGGSYAVAAGASFIYTGDCEGGTLRIQDITDGETFTGTSHNSADSRACAGSASLMGGLKSISGFHNVQCQTSAFSANGHGGYTPTVTMAAIWTP